MMQLSRTSAEVRLLLFAHPNMGIFYKYAMMPARAEMRICSKEGCAVSCHQSHALVLFQFREFRRLEAQAWYSFERNLSSVVILYDLRSDVCS